MEPEIQKQIGTTEFGLIKGLSYDDYVKVDALRHSDAKLFARSALHARFAMLHPEDDTSSTRMGTALHLALLEPNRFGTDYAVGPKVDKRTKQGKQDWLDFEAAFPKAILLRGEEYEAVRGMAEAVHNHPFIDAVIGKKSLREVVSVWNENGVSCKCRTDWAVELDGWSYVIDLKSTRDASADEFAKDINRYKYHGQAASNLRGLQRVKPLNRLRRWLWVAVENTPPHGIAIYEPSDGLLEQGEQEYLGWVTQYAHAVRTNTWNGYPAPIQQIDLPKWAWRNERLEEVK